MVLPVNHIEGLTKFLPLQLDWTASAMNKALSSASASFH
jgi:hypothetical protein